MEQDRLDQFTNAVNSENDIKLSKLMEAPIKGPRLSLLEMAIKYPDQGVVIPGSSLWVSDSGLQCVKTKSWNGVPLKRNQLVNLEPKIQTAMKNYDKESLCCFCVSSGGNIADILEELDKAILRLEAEADGTLAKGKFPMFEFGVIGVFHNDHTLSEGVRGQYTFMGQRESEGPKGMKGPVNDQYWSDLQEVADKFAALVKRPTALVGGDPTK
jgi:hypothetical protein